MKKKVICVKSWNGTEFYFDTWNGKFVQYDKADLSSINFTCNELDIESAENIALQEGLPANITLTEIDFKIS